jgi:hypothetical protein
VVPLLAELAEPVAYLGILLPLLEKRLRRSGHKGVDAILGQLAAGRMPCYGAWPAEGRCS